MSRPKVSSQSFRTVLSIILESVNEPFFFFISEKQPALKRAQTLPPQTVTCNISAIMRTVLVVKHRSYILVRMIMVICQPLR